MQTTKLTLSLFVTLFFNIYGCSPSSGAEACPDEYWVEEYGLSVCLNSRVSQAKERMPFVKYQESSREFSGIMDVRGVTVGYGYELKGRRIAILTLAYGSAYENRPVGIFESQMNRDDSLFFRGEKVVVRDEVRYERFVIQRGDRLDVFVKISSL